MSFLMLTKALDMPADLAEALLIRYSFDLGGYSAGELINHWLNDYPAKWVALAVIEALYQGRYKAISVEQILAFWHRRGQALYHFNYEFERLICSNFLVGLSDGHNDPPVPPLTNNSCGEELADEKVAQTTENERTRSHNVFFAQSPRSYNRLSVQQFTPTAEWSEFYTKLKAISQGSRDATDQSTK